MKKELREKIISLFEYRRLPELITYGGMPFDNAFYEKLIHLQYQIYMLDHELETNWHVDNEIISKRWQKIYEALIDLDIETHLHDKFCNHIYKYQKHELELRIRKLPTRLSMEYFYFYKSCDVKLLRRIIYLYNSKLSKTINQANWRLFDLVTEINDDVTDLQEDIYTINGNRFLISLKLFGKVKTRSIFEKCLYDIGDRNQKTNLVFEDLNLTNWTQIKIEETLSILQDQIDQFDSLNTDLYDRLVEKQASVY